MGAEVLLPLIGTIGGSAIQGSMANSGAQNQATMTKEMYDADRQREYDEAQYLKNLMPTFNTTMPDPNQYFGSQGVNNQFDIARSNLSQLMGSQVADAQSSAAALGASRGFANPSAFTLTAGQGVRDSFAPQFGQLEASRAGALNDQMKNLYQALFGQTQYGNTLKQLEYSNQFNLADSFGNPSIAPTPIAPKQTAPVSNPVSPYTNKNQYGQPYGYDPSNPFGVRR